MPERDPFSKFRKINARLEAQVDRNTGGWMSRLPNWMVNTPVIYGALFGLTWGLGMVFWVLRGDPPVAGFVKVAAGAGVVLFAGLGTAFAVREKRRRQASANHEPAVGPRQLLG